MFSVMKLKPLSNFMPNFFSLSIAYKMLYVKTCLDSMNIEFSLLIYAEILVKMLRIF